MIPLGRDVSSWHLDIHGPKHANIDPHETDLIALALNFLKACGGFRALLAWGVDVRNGRLELAMGSQQETPNGRRGAEISFALSVCIVFMPIYMHLYKPSAECTMSSSFTACEAPRS